MDLTDLLPAVEGLTGPIDISMEARRDYKLPNGEVYSIYLPVALYYKKGSHRVVDVDGVTHYIPFNENTILKWKNKDGVARVQF